MDLEEPLSLVFLNFPDDTRYSEIAVKNLLDTVWFLGLVGGPFDNSTDCSDGLWMVNHCQLEPYGKILSIPRGCQPGGNTLALSLRKPAHALGAVAGPFARNPHLCAADGLWWGDDLTASLGKD